MPAVVSVITLGCTWCTLKRASAMGCGASTAKVSEADKATLANAQFTDIPPVWSPVGGWSPVNVETIIATGATIENPASVALSPVILNVANDKAVSWALSDPRDGKVVMTVSNADSGNFFTGKPSTWKINSATGPFGSFEQKMKKGGGTLDYFDTSGALVMKCKVTGSTTCKIFGPDGASLAAVVTGIWNDPRGTARGAGKQKGTCTFAKGADPIMALAMALSLMSMMGGA